jgi:SAM-dependent methyltransferase
MTAWVVPLWVNEVLAVPGGASPATIAGDRIISAKGEAIGYIDSGVLRFGVRTDDPSIHWYQKVGGANFHDRSKVAYAMTTLDTPVYAEYLKLIRPDVENALIADIGGGDGRNAVPWLAETGTRVAVVDPIVDGLERFRHRIEQEHPEWLDRVLLIEGDARNLPLRDGAFDAVQSVEALYYLNEDYETGLKQCRRLLKDRAKLLISERDYEGALLLQLLYFDGIAGLLKQSKSRDVWDGSPGNMVRSRSFTRDELVEVAKRCGLDVLEQIGISSMSLVLSYLRGAGKLGGPEDERLVPEVHALLQELGRHGRMMRAHTLVCRKA